MSLFHFDGAPQNADAIRFTTPSGARVFAGGAQQLSWSLDPFNTGRFGRTRPADERLQRFVRNAFADLLRPARPQALDSAVVGRRVTLTISRKPDPRVSQFQIYRHKTRSPFRIEDSGVARVCTTAELTCVNKRVPRGTYRYAVVALDDWGAVSAVTLSRKVVVEGPPP